MNTKEEESVRLKAMCIAVNYRNTPLSLFLPLVLQMQHYE